MKRPKAYSYVRMSTESQLHGDSLRRQTEASQLYADKHDLDLTYDFDLHDIGVSAYSGDNLASGKFGRFLEAVQAGKIEKGSYLLVESFDRMSRQEPLIALESFRAIVGAGLILVTLDDEQVYQGNIRTDQLLFSILKMVRANEESALKSVRVGKAWGAKRLDTNEVRLTKRCPHWLLPLDDGGWEIIDERAAIVRRIFNYANSGLGTYSIVRRLNAEGHRPPKDGPKGWALSSVNRILKDRAVIGKFQPCKLENGKRVPDGPLRERYYPRIVSDAVYEAAQRIRLSRSTKPSSDAKGSGGRKGKHYSNLFSKLAVCASCGEPMHFENKGTPPKGQSYLVCSSVLRGLTCAMTGRWRADHFEAAFLKFVERLDLASLVSSEEHQSKRTELVAQLDAAEGRQKILEKEIEVCFATSMRLENGSEILARELAKRERELAETKAEQANVRHQITQLDESALAYYSNPDQMADLIARVRSTRGEGVFKVRALIASRLQALIKNIKLTIGSYGGREQSFEVDFRDGAFLMAFVDPNDPTNVVRIIRANGSEFTVKDAEGNIIDEDASAEYGFEDV